MTPPFAPDVLGLVRAGHDIYRFVRDARLRGLGKGAEGARAIEDLYTRLRAKYFDLDVLASHRDGPFPTAVLELEPSRALDPEKLTGKRVEARPIAFSEDRLVEALQAKGKNLWNGLTFSLAEVHLDERGLVHSLDAYVGSYFRQLSSGKYLEYELLKAVLDRTDRTPVRSRILAGFPSPRDCLLSGGGVDAAISLSALVVYKRGPGYWMFCELRAEKVAEGAGLYHVVPSGIFQPVTSPTSRNLRLEFSLEHNLYREYLEELFGVSEAQRGDGAVDPYYFYGHPNLEYLNSLVNAGAAKLFGSCLMFDLFSHRAEVCMLLIIEDPDWYDSQKDVFVAGRKGLKHLALCSEFVSNETRSSESSLERVATLPLEDPGWAEVARPWNMVPQGAPSLILGAKEACRRLNLAEPDWLASFYVDRGSLH